MSDEDKQSHFEGRTLSVSLCLCVCLLKSDEILRDLSFSQKIQSLLAVATSVYHSTQYNIPKDFESSGMSVLCGQLF